MAGILDELMGQLSGGDGPDLGSLLGGALDANPDPAAAEQATKGGLAAILAGLAKNAKDGDGAAALRDAVGNHDGNILNDIPSKFGAAETVQDGSKILGHVFGDDREAVQTKLAETSGMDLGSIAKLLPMLAPIVMGLLGRKAQGSGMDASGLAGMLSDEAGGLDLGDLTDLLGGESGGMLSGLMDKVKDTLGGDTSA